MATEAGGTGINPVPDHQFVELDSDNDNERARSQAKAPDGEAVLDEAGNEIINPEGEPWLNDARDVSVALEDIPPYRGESAHPDRKNEPLHPTEIAQMARSACELGEH